METRIHEALNETYQNYILPFFWQHGETETVLRTYMKTIQDMGIQAVCLESRPHPEISQAPAGGTIWILSLMRQNSGI